MNLVQFQGRVLANARALHILYGDLVALRQVLRVTIQQWNDLAPQDLHIDLAELYGLSEKKEIEDADAQDEQGPIPGL